MNRNKKTFTPNMRVAALYLLMGVLLLLAVTLFSGRESMRATEEYFDRTINFVKVQSTSYEKYNDTITAKSLRRMAVSVRQLAENDALDIYDPEALRKETESLWLTGIAVLDENGESLCEYTDGNIDYAQFAESLREQAALNVLQNPQKTYLKRILLQDGTAVDVATRRAAAGDAVLLAYRVTPPEFVEGTALSIQSVLDGYPKNISGTIFIVQDNKVIAANDPSLIGLYTTNSPLVQGIRKAGAPDILTHTRDWANSGCYFGMYSNGQNFDLYLYIDEKSVFRNFSSALLTALIFYLICQKHILYSHLSVTVVTLILYLLQRNLSWHTSFFSVCDITIRYDYFAAFQKATIAFRLQGTGDQAKNLAACNIIFCHCLIPLCGFTDHRTSQANSIFYLVMIIKLVFIKEYVLPSVRFQSLFLRFIQPD